MGSFTNGALWVLGAFVAFLFVIALIVAVVYFGFKTGTVQGLAKDSIKNLVGLG